MKTLTVFAAKMLIIMTLSEDMLNSMLNSRNLKYDPTDSAHTLTR